MRILIPLFFTVSLLTAQTDSVRSTLVFLSDTQAPMWVEKLYLKDYDNEKATQNIFSSILKEQSLDAVIHCGDITAYGMSRSKWEAVLPFFDSLKARSIPFVAAKGNHDYYFISSWAMERYKEYIPEGKREYSLHLYGNTAIVALNSNLEKLEDSVREEQMQWYSSMLQSLHKDSTVRFVITVLHHSPYTNSNMVSGSATVRKEYLPAFYASPKSKLFVSGHAHRFEHFNKKGKDFLVIGGGGGLFHDKRIEKPHNDLHTADGKFFHYVKCAAYADSLSVDVIKVEPHSSETKIEYHISIKKE